MGGGAERCRETLRLTLPNKIPTTMSWTITMRLARFDNFRYLVTIRRPRVITPRWIRRKGLRDEFCLLLLSSSLSLLSMDIQSCVEVAAGVAVAKRSVDAAEVLQLLGMRLQRCNGTAVVVHTKPRPLEARGAV